AGHLSFSGTSLVINYQNLLDSVKYLSTDAHPSDGHAAGADQHRSVEWQVNDGSGLNNLSLVATTDVTVDFAPIVDLDVTDGAGSNNFTQFFIEDDTNGGHFIGTGPVSIGNAVDITDDDNGFIEKATIDLTNAKPGDVLEYLGSDPNITLDPSSTATHILLTGHASKADYATAIQLVTFNNTSENPDTTDRIINTVVNDGLADGNTAVTTVQVTSVNETPINTVPPAQTTNEDIDLVFSAANGNAISISDADIGAGGATVTLS